MPSISVRSRRPRGKGRRASATRKSQDPKPKTQDPYGPNFKDAASLLGRRRKPGIFRNVSEEKPVTLPRWFLLDVADRLEDACELLESVPRFRRAIEFLFETSDGSGGDSGAGGGGGRPLSSVAPESAAALDTLTMTICHCVEKLDAAIRIAVKRSVTCDASSRR